LGSDPDFRIADAHLHLWDAQAHDYPWLRDRPVEFRYGDYGALPRRYLVEDYWRDAGEWKVVRGVRHKPRPGMMDDARWRAGYRRLAPLRLHFELQAPWRQLDEAARLARDFPDTTIVLNHAGLPATADLSGWRRAMGALAACPNAMVKISGLGNLDAAAKREALLAAIELFGARRTMFASNYPVDSLRDSFERIYAGFDEATRGFSPAERRDLFHDNAVRIYRME